MTKKFKMASGPPSWNTVVLNISLKLLIQPRDSDFNTIALSISDLTTNMLMRRLHDPTFGPTGRSYWSVQQLDQQLRRVNGCPTDWTNQTCQIHPTGWTKGCIV